MTYPRAHLVDTVNGGYYHLTSRCVRRAFLCGFDQLSSRNFDHRRQWIEDRILQLGNIFAVTIYGYAVMSNHYHVVVKVNPQQVDTWPDDEVVDRWLQLCPGGSQVSTEQLNLRRAVVLADSQKLALIRSHLGSLSWFMRFINEPLARMANQEDQCSGRFWEGRFKSQALLDDAALLACMVYVDLNPVRAGIADDIAQAAHTSVSNRIRHHHHSQPLIPLTQGSEDEPSVPIALADYISLVHAVADQQQSVRRGIKPKLVHVLAPFDLDHNQFMQGYHQQHTHWQRAMGSMARIKSHLSELGLQHLRRTRKKHLTVLSTG
jgi:REP element-mobilizing transposase RayT